MSADPKIKVDDLNRLRHSAAHVLAQAMRMEFPTVKFGIGPAIENGFYYDFDLPRPLVPEDLSKIEARMKDILRKGHPFIRKEVLPEEAEKIFADQPYKLELIKDILSAGSDSKLSIYTNGDFTDLCQGPHVVSTDEIPVDGLKLLSIAGAYWRGKSENPMLQRIYGTAWESVQDLEQYLARIEEAKKRDHRTLGKQLELFSTADEVGAGLILWHPKGGMVRYLAEQFSKEAHRLNGYDFVYTPHIGKASLWETSGHLGFYRENMYSPMKIDEEEYFIKPMNCPFHTHIYKARTRSYRDLPLRWAEFGTVYRYEFSGALHGLTRVRGFTQDDAHIFCTPDQVKYEVARALNFSLYILRAFGLDDFTAYVSTRPLEKSIGADADWEIATKALVNAVEDARLTTKYDHGGGAFYGPKIDLKVTDSLNREWQLSTVQLDFNLPERFDLNYIGSDGQPHRPFMIHRALFGSVERFIGMLIENYMGAFPFWLAPVQTTVISITDDALPYVYQVAQRLRDEGLRIEIDERSERMQAKIRDSQMMKVPYAIVVGRKEMQNGMISLRCREKGDLGTMSVEDFLTLSRKLCAAGVPQTIS